MKKIYKKPTVIQKDNIQGIIPLAAVGAAVAGLSAAQAAAVASAVGLGLGLASKTGKDNVTALNCKLQTQN